jgi:hypothetical protein
LPRDPARYLEPSRAGAPLLRPLKAGQRPEAHAAHTGVVDEEQKRGRRKEAAEHHLGPPWTTTSRPASHRRRQQAHLHRHQRGGCRLRETLTAPLLIYSLAPGPAGPTGPQRAVNRPADPQAVDSGPQAALPPSVSRSPLDPLNFQKVQKKPLNFYLALRLLSYIYSDLLVLYIYILDLELFCNFML